MTGGRARGLGPGSHQDGAVEQMSIPWGSLETRGVGELRKKKRLDVLHVEWNFSVEP